MRLPGQIVFQLFLRASRVQKKRAILTVAAIAWGTLSLLLLMAFGEGLSISLSKAKAGMGTNLAVIWPGETTREWRGMPSGREIRPRIADLRLLEERVRDLVGVSGEIIQWGTSFTNGEITVNGPLKAASTVWGSIRNQIPLAGGRFLNPLDDAQRRRVVFLGDALAEKLFASADPIGRTILIDNVPYTVIGVLIEKLMMGNYSGMDQDHAVIPLRTYHAQYGRDRLSNLILQPRRPADMKRAIGEVRRVLAGRYGFDPEDEEVLGVWDTVEGSAVFEGFLVGIEIFLGIIGALTLAVGGIGVANIMVAVINERTREIGVKMALGARSHWITGPIVLEGLTYTLLGGVTGLVMATVLVMLLELVPTGDSTAIQMLGKPTLSTSIAATAAGILGILGLLAGYFPARRAAAIEPAETLRYE